jgi:hypothetical protein
MAHARAAAAKGAGVFDDESEQQQQPLECP